ncbi:MAG: M48 family metalloprotease [Marinilabiliaceae bacterium]|nr:M48 family metalloprotease [Marinilabiliaceae bacterium]
MKTIQISILVFTTLWLTACGDRGVNFFSVDDDKSFGEELVKSLEADPVNYPVLPRQGNEKAYLYIETMMNDILKSDQFKFKDRFDWEVHIINQDVLNAFAAPGGKLYFYTGLIKYLDDAASLAGVMGHEMAHADLRHSTQQMTKVYGFDILMSIILGQNAGEMTNIAKDLALGLGTLKFSRDNEYDADRYSMYYLAATKYDPRGIGSFFEKMIDNSEGSSTPAWLSTHPSDDKRLQNIADTYTKDEEFKKLFKGDGSYGLYKEEYDAFKNLLP